MIFVTSSFNNPKLHLFLRTNIRMRPEGTQDGIMSMRIFLWIDSFQFAQFVDAMFKCSGSISISHSEYFFLVSKFHDWRVEMKRWEFDMYIKLSSIERAVDNNNNWLFDLVTLQFLKNILSAKTFSVTND